MSDHSFGPGCRLHGPSCRIPWGYDPAHTDQAHPYTLAELAARTEPPHRFAYPSVGEYVEAFHLYRAISRDDLPTEAEARAKLVVLGEALGMAEEQIAEILA